MSNQSMDEVPIGRVLERSHGHTPGVVARLVCDVLHMASLSSFIQNLRIEWVSISQKRKIRWSVRQSVTVSVTWALQCEKRNAGLNLRSAAQAQSNTYTRGRNTFRFQLLGDY